MVLLIFVDTNFRGYRDKNSYKYTALYRGQLCYRYNNVLDIAVYKTSNFVDQINNEIQENCH